MSAFSLSTPLADLPWVRSPQAAKLKKAGLQTVGDLLQRYPRRYEDRRKFDPFPINESDDPVCLSGTIIGVSTQRWGRRTMFEATLQEGEGGALSPTIGCRWFNAFYISKMLAKGQRMVVYGRAKRKGRRMVIDHPDFEVIDEDGEDLIHMKRITPVHPGGDGLQPRALRTLVFKIIERIDDLEVGQILPAGLDPTTRQEALSGIHFPLDEDDYRRARRHLVLTEFFAMQMVICSRKAEQDALPGECHALDGPLLPQFYASLPFPLTAAQQRCIGEIRADLASSHAMNRLLQGDVGSGKTLVALAAMLSVVEAGFQAALMAPTQILAEQHYLNFKKLLTPLGIRLALRTGTRKEESHLPLFGAEGDSGDEAQIIVGTHSLLFESFKFTNLGLAVIDEQHKFGVLQRAKLIAQGEAPDVLVMTATPIPRTMAMTFYGDLAVSSIDELPPGRGAILTAIRDDSGLAKVCKFLRDQLDDGRQVYIVYPVIDESEKAEVKAATVEFEKWTQLLAPSRCALLHGRVPGEEKDTIMQQFRDAEIDVLVATSVIEVGIDVPNATVMVIENAERFGLAQLHQLRGRIGRGKHKSYCALLTTKEEDDEARERLKILEQTRDGFVIADEDFKIRGPGDMLGTAQSGLPPLRLGDLRRDAQLMRAARAAAQQIYSEDPTLSQAKNEHFRHLVVDGRKASIAQVS